MSVVRRCNADGRGNEFRFLAQQPAGPLASQLSDLIVVALDWSRDMRLAVILVAGLLSGCATPVSSDKAESAGADKVCKRIAMTGSNVTERVCLTRE